MWSQSIFPAEVECLRKLLNRNKTHWSALEKLIGQDKVKVVSTKTRGILCELCTGDTKDNFR